MSGTMYPGKVNSPVTLLLTPLTATDTTAQLLDVSVLPPAPNIAVIGTDSNAETIKYDAISGNTLTGLTRGFQGTAKVWPANTEVARRFTEYDYSTLRQTIMEILQNAGILRGDMSLFPLDYTGANPPYNFTVITGEREGIPFTEIWILVNARYDRVTHRFKRIDLNNFSFGWQMQGGGTYPGEGGFGDLINQGVNLWRAYGKNAFAEGDPMRNQITEDIGVMVNGVWTEYAVILGWNNTFMCDSYGGMTVGGAGFEIDGNGVFPYKRVSLGKYTGIGGEDYPNYEDYGFAYNATLWNVYHGMFDSDRKQDNSFYWGMISPIDFEFGGSHNPQSGKVLLNDTSWVWRMLPAGAAFEVDNWQDIVRIHQDGTMFLRGKKVQLTEFANATIFMGGGPGGINNIAYASYPPNWYAANTYVVAVKAVYTGGISRQIHPVVTFEASRMTIPATADMVQVAFYLQTR